MATSLVLDGSEFMEVERSGFKQRVPVGSMAPYHNSADFDAAVDARIAAATRQLAYQAVAYAAAITIDPTLGAVVKVGALTGNIAINAPSGPQAGDVLVVCLKQDGTGGKTVTWNAVFVDPPETESAANARTVGTFVYADSVWQ